ncbi:MAG TPA: cytochrome b/b6 domain-containing protein [Gemmatimonadales bacterium]|nr:cytochrome b/b6 domain-containing protein [Gemmatimonadales bacterium]
MAGTAVRVWDLPTRIFHWTLVALVAFSFTTGKVGGGWMEWHVKSGYAILALLLFRVAWGLVGSDTSRFAHFLRGPRAAWRYGRETLAGRHPTLPGHNPLGGWMVLLMLAVLAVQATSGLFVDDEIATQGPLAARASGEVVGRMSELHEDNQWVIVGVVSLHVLAILAYRFALRVSLVPAMWHGRAPVPPGVAPPRMRPTALAAALLAIAAGFVYWLVAIFPRG